VLIGVLKQIRSFIEKQDIQLYEILIG